MFYSFYLLLRNRKAETASVSYSELLFDLCVFCYTLYHYLSHYLIWIGSLMTPAISCAFTYRGFIFAICYVLIQVGLTFYVNYVLGKHHFTANFKRIMGWFCISSFFVVDKYNNNVSIYLCDCL